MGKSLLQQRRLERYVNRGYPLSASRESLMTLTWCRTGLWEEWRDPFQMEFKIKLNVTKTRCNNGIFVHSRLPLSLSLPCLQQLTTTRYCLQQLTTTRYLPSDPLNGVSSSSMLQMPDPINRYRAEIKMLNIPPELLFTETQLWCSRRVELMPFYLFSHGIYEQKQKQCTLNMDANANARQETTP